MALVLLQGRAFSSPSTSHSSILPYHGSLPYSNLSGSLFEAQLLRDSEFSRSIKETNLLPFRNRLKPSRASALPQRPLGEHHKSRQDVGGRAGTKPELNSSLKQPKHIVPASSESTPPLPLMRSTPLGQSLVWNILSPPHAPPTSFLSQPAELQNDALLSDSDDEEAIRRSSFTMLLAICCALQLVYITEAVSLWVARLRLRYFDSPFTYSDVNQRSKLGRIGVFWDIENCPIPAGMDAQMVVKQMHKIGSSFGTIQCLRAYGKLEYLTRQAPSLLQMGVELCPVPDGKESADKAIIMDALLFGYDHKPCPDTPLFEKDASTGNGIVLVTGDRGFCALLRELSNRQITTVVIGNGHQKIPPILAQAADFSIQWDEMMETSNFRSGSYGQQNSRFTEKFSITEDDQMFEIGGWDASSSCNVLLKYDQSRVDDQIPSGCEKSQIIEGCQDAEALDLSSDNGILGILPHIEKRKGKNAADDGLINFNSNPQNDGYFKNGRSLCDECKDLEMEICTDSICDDECTESQAAFPNPCDKASDVRRQPVDVDYSNYIGSGNSKVVPPVGGRVRILRHLRCEVAYVVDKYCKGKPKAVMTFEQFELLYELEMGHPLVTSHYGFASLKSILQSMPDLLSVRNVSSESADWRIFPIVKHGDDRKFRINYSRQDLRCILYKILHSYWPHGVPKDQISAEHCKLTGRPLVLVAYEYWRLADMVQTMGDLMYVDEKSKQIYLADGASEPQGLREREQNRWN
ncbi:hypothetical protein M758_9G156900 [Ceratodon purpureus]|nr:hypothetical protein M758_9G156900 [Ceratodon purpureus]